MTALKILVCNDDGIGSPGLRAASEAVLGLGEVVVVGPQRQQTASGRSLTAHPDAVLDPVDFRVDGRLLEAYQADCAPARLVQHAVRALFPLGLPALVVSGINYGENVGTTITSSGTVGAALQAASYGVPALAVSRRPASSTTSPTASSTGPRPSISPASSRRSSWAAGSGRTWTCSTSTSRPAPARTRPGA